MTGGMAFEGLNNLGHSGRRVITILNDNGRSYAPTASRLGRQPGQAARPPDVPAQHRPDRAVVRDLPGGEVLERGWDSATHALREMFEPPAFFEDLGVAYLGPLDGHDIDALERALAAAKEMDGPVVVHVLTQKGRGYAPPRTTRSSTCTTWARSRTAATPAPFPRRSSPRPKPGPNWWRSPPPCPTPPGCCR
jgi:1-deoxy-D-xylulose-5-phosphate synthase